MTAKRFPKSEESVKYFEARRAHLQGLLAIWAVPMIALISAVNWLAQIEPLYIKFMLTFSFLALLTNAAFLYFCVIYVNRSIMTIRHGLAHGTTDGTVADDSNTEVMATLFATLSIMGVLGILSLAAVVLLVVWQAPA